MINTNRHNYNRSDRIAHAKKRTARISISIIRGLFLLGICFTVIYPVLSKLFYSFMEITDVYNPALTYLPSRFTLINYEIAMSILDYGKTFINTFFLSLSTAALQLIAALMVAYGLARFQFFGQKFLFVALIIVMVIPPDLLLIPRYFQFRFFDFFGIIEATAGKPVSFVDTYVPFWLMGITCTGLKNGLYVFLLRQSFLGLPKALEEAAKVDGAGPIRTFIQIVLPGSVNISVAVFLFSFVWQWNDSVYSPVFLNKLGVFSNYLTLIPSKAYIALGVLTADLASSLVGAAGILLVLSPIILLYAFAQKFFTQSISQSGLTG